MVHLVFSSTIIEIFKKNHIQETALVLQGLYMTQIKRCRQNCPYFSMKCFYRLQLNHDKNNLRLRQSIYFKQIRAHICVNL